MTNDLARRIIEPRVGEIPAFSAHYRCHKLLYYEHCTNALDAIACQKQIKRRWGAKKVTLVDNLNPRWFDLAENILVE